MRYTHFDMLPEKAFQRSPSGSITPQGGGSGTSAPSSQTVTNTSIPEYAQPYVERTLGQTAALTDINQNPYQPYQGQQVAGFTPLQTQAMQNIANQQVAPQLAEASNLASTVGQGGIGAYNTAGGLQQNALNYGAQGANLGIMGGGMYGGMAAQAGNQYASQATNPNAVGAYMSPYMQDVVETQKREANRAYDITGQQVQGQGVTAGAFGGTRDALMRAENERNRNTALNQIQASGSQAAYDKAIQSLQYGSNLGLQGLQTGLQGVNTQLAGTGQGLAGVQGAVGAGQYGLAGLGATGQAASTLGALGQTQFGQEQAINQAQLQAGAQQQQLQQQALNTAYQQYQDQLNYPYKQLAFQSDMFRGMPLSQSASTIYQNTGNFIPQLAGAGIAAYGANAGKTAKEGGVMKSYAMGGQTQVDPNVARDIGQVRFASKLSMLSDDQLQAYARTIKDPAAKKEVIDEMQRRAETRQASQVAQTQEQQSGIGAGQEVMAAGGGIIALADGSKEAVREKSVLDFLTERNRAPERTPVSDTTIAAIAPDVMPAGSVDVSKLDTPSSIMPAQSNPAMAAMADKQIAENNAHVAANAEGAQFGARMAADDQVQYYRDDDRQAQNDTNAELYAANGPEGAGQYPNLTAAPPNTAPGGIATGRTAPATGAPAPATGAGGAGDKLFYGDTKGTRGVGAPTAGAPAAGGIGNLLGWDTYAANVEKAAKLDPEDKAVLANMEARTVKRLARAERQEANVMNEALVAGGLAMMSGMNLSDGIRRLAESGGKQYFASKADAQKAIDKAEDAQDAFDQYRVALKQGNKKVAAEMYGKYYNATTDYMGKIDQAKITAGASLENAKAQREATEAYRNMENKRHDLDREALMQRHRENITERKDEFRIRMEETGNQKAVQAGNALETRYNANLVEQRHVREGIEKAFAKQAENINMSADKPEVKARKLQALQDQFDAKLGTELQALKAKEADLLSQQDSLIRSALGGGSQFKVTGVR